MRYPMIIFFALAFSLALVTPFQAQKRNRSTTTISKQTGITEIRPKVVEIIRRDQLGVSSIGDGRARVLWTTSLVDPGRVGYRDLDPLITFAYDEVPAGGGFKLHDHKNAEIITIVLEGSLDHEDTAGHRSRLNAGEVGLMAAGSGVKHSEFGNPDVQTRSVTLWLKPRTMNKPPSHMTAKPVEQKDGWSLIAAERDAPLIVEQDARILIKRLASHKRVSVTARTGRLIYLGVVGGAVVADGQRLSTPERILLRNGKISITSDAGATLVMVDVPWTVKQGK